MGGPSQQSSASSGDDPALADVAGLLRGLTDADVVRPSADPQAAAATALLVADYLGQPDLRAKLDAHGMGLDAVVNLRKLARAITTFVTRLGGEYLPDATAIPGDLVQRGQHARTTIAAALEKALPEDRDLQVLLDAVRLGTGVVDLVYDLRTLGGLCTVHGSAGGGGPESAQSAFAAADAVEFALRTGDSPERATTRNTIAKLWNLFVPAYERAAAAGRALTRSQGKERDFPPLSLVAAHRRARRHPVSVMPPARIDAPKPPKPPKPLKPYKPAPPPKKPEVPKFDEVELIEAEDIVEDEHDGHDAGEVVTTNVSEPPRRTRPSEPPTQGERLSWSDTRLANRQTLDIEVGVTSQSNLYLGFTENISAGGVFVATYVTKAIGAEVEVALAFPNGDELKVPGIVRWLREATTEGWPGMGVQFQSLTAQDEATLRKFLSVRDPLFYDE